MNIFTQLWALFRYKRKLKKEMSAKISAALPGMRKGSKQMNELGGRLRLRQLQGKFKHDGYTRRRAK